MFDWNLQLRFWRSATEAMLEGATATLAAAGEFQSHLLAEAEPKAASKAPAPQPLDAFNPFSWTNAWWQVAMSAAAPQPAPRAAPIDPLNPVTWFPAWVTTPVGTSPIAPDQWMKFTTDFWFNRAPAWATAPAWTIWHGPFTLMLMSTGMPHSVASPAARASAASLDAADAAREQMSLAFAAYRSDGGHAAASIATWPLSVMSEMAAVTLSMPSPSKSRH